MTAPIASRAPAPTAPPPPAPIKTEKAGDAEGKTTGGKDRDDAPVAGGPRPRPNARKRADAQARHNQGDRAARAHFDSKRTLLRDPALKGDPTPDKVAAGQDKLAPGARGPAVRRVQQSLQKRGVPLPKYGADGAYGDETKSAVEKFQRSVKLPPTGVVDDKTLAALEQPRVKMADSKAAAKATPNYDEMFKDGVMEVTVAHGFTKDGSDEKNLPKVRANLKQEGLSRVEVAGKSPAQLRKLGIDPAKVKPGVEYFHKSMEHNGKPVNMVVRVLTSKTPNARAVFKDAMASSDVVQYIGHGRYGSGPDFDGKASMKGNYVIGQAYAPYMNQQFRHQRGSGAATDLQNTKFDAGKYQLMAFYGCKTKYYRDDLRRVPGKDRSNLHILGTNESIHAHHASYNINRTISGLARKDDFSAMVGDMNANSGTNQVFFDGE